MAMSERLEAALRHDREIVAAALVGIVAVAWGYMVYEARGMELTGICRCAGMAMSGPDSAPWSRAALVPLSLMWAEMMVAMMIPSAAPLILSPMMKSTSPLLGGALLVGVGIFQWTPWKRACLNHCRSPLSFLLTGWREGRSGALRMGLEHGAYCAGCCWLLMALLFVAGVMNMWWVAAITILVLLEKVVPHGTRVGAVAGLVFVAWGMALIVLSPRI
jgi:predicted metal-binding membrane protein